LSRRNLSRRSLSRGLAGFACLLSLFERFVLVVHQRRANLLFTALLADNVNEVGARQFKSFLLTQLVELPQMNARHTLFASCLT
jgi:hypothetical protein